MLYTFPRQPGDDVGFQRRHPGCLPKREFRVSTRGDGNQGDQLTQRPG